MDYNQKPCTWHIVQEAMKIVSKDVRAPKCVRDGIVLPCLSFEGILNEPFAKCKKCGREEWQHKL